MARIKTIQWAPGILEVCGFGLGISHVEALNWVEA